MVKRSASMLVGGWRVAAVAIAAGCSGSADTGQSLDGGIAAVGDASVIPQPGSGGAAASEGGASNVPVSCSSDKDCRAAGELCDVERNVCVECVSNVDCADGKSCAAGSCRSKCASDKDCTAAGLLCDVAAGHCVDPGSGGSGGSNGAGGQGGALGIGGDGSGGSNESGGSGGSGGNGGSAGAGGSGENGGNAGTGGSSGAGGNPVVDAGSCGPIIDDMEDGNGYICQGNGRVGRWYTFSIGGSVTPSAATIPAPPGVIPAGRDTSVYAMHVVGSLTSGGALGVDLKNDNGSYGTFDAGSYTGFRFWARSSVTLSLQVRVNCASTTSTSYGGTCTLGDLCSANYALKTLTSTWTLVTVPFATVSGGSYTFSSRNLTNVQFFTASSSFDFWIDDVSFY